MILETEYLYHIFNQGNNGQRIFFNRENYLFFLKKTTEFMLPYADILAWCLMPNHFHFMVYVHDMEVEVADTDGFTLGQRTDGFTLRGSDTDGFTLARTSINSNISVSEAVSKSPSEAVSKLPSEAVSNSKPKKKRNFNDSIGLQLRSYTRAINIQENRTGSLFRTPTKAECITKIGEITPSFFNKSFGTMFNRSIPELEYPKICFNYIHYNPVNAKLAKHPEDWEFSSYRDYCGLRMGKLVNKERAKEFLEWE